VKSYIDLQFAPNWDLIDPAREFLQAFFAHALKDELVASQVSMAAHELMENAVKYSPTDDAKIRVEVGDDDGPIRICVENPADPANVAVLLDEVRQAGEATDTLAFYRRKMEEAYQRSDGKSCLGLARIRCEGQMDLDCHITGNVVRMIAIRHR
jgi:hypothetical protein